MIKYLTSTKSTSTYGLAEIEIVELSPKSYRIDNIIQLRGYVHKPYRLSKDDVELHDTLKDAIQYIIEMAQHDREQILARLRNVNQQIDFFESSLVE